MRLTDEQCDVLRSLPMAFNDMIREIYRQGLIKAADIVEEQGLGTAVWELIVEEASHQEA